MRVTALYKAFDLWLGEATAVRVQGVCAAGCEGAITYLITMPAAGCAPEVYAEGSPVAFKGGHMCAACLAKVEGR